MKKKIPKIPKQLTAQELLDEVEREQKKKNFIDWAEMHKRVARELEKERSDF